MRREIVIDLVAPRRPPGRGLPRKEFKIWPFEQLLYPVILLVGLLAVIAPVVDKQPRHVCRRLPPRRMAPRGKKALLRICQCPITLPREKPALGHVGQNKGRGT